MVCSTLVCSHFRQFYFYALFGDYGKRCHSKSCFSVFFSLLSQVVRENWDLLPSLASLEFGLESEDEKEGATAKKKEVYASLRNALVDCLETAWEKKSWSWAKVIIDKSKIQ